MPDKEPEQAVSGWKNLIEGGLPQMIAGPAGKAISRLIGAGVDIPAAWLEQQAQAIRDKTKAKSAVMGAVADSAAGKAAGSIEVQDRAVHALLAKEFREQTNREAVAQKTVELLIEARATDREVKNDAPAPDDDWMNLFEAHASRASSDRMRDLFARVLAGEIRRSGSFSLTTMQFVSVLDAVTAQAITSVAPWVYDGNFIFKDALGTAVPYGALVSLEDAGFLALGAGLLKKTYTANEHGQVVIACGDEGVVLTTTPEAKIQLPGFPLSRSGRELLGVISYEPNTNDLVRELWKREPLKIEIGTIKATGSGAFHVINLR